PEKCDGRAGPVGPGARPHPAGGADHRGSRRFKGHPAAARGGGDWVSEFGSEVVGAVSAHPLAMIRCAAFQATTEVRACLSMIGRAFRRESFITSITSGFPR